MNKAQIVHEGDYLALVDVFSRATRRTYPQGSHVDLSHCTDGERAMLVKRGAVRHDPQGEGLRQSDRYELQDVRGINAAKAHALAQLGVTTMAEFVGMSDDMVTQAAASLGTTEEKIQEYQVKAREIG